MTQLARKSAIGQLSREPVKPRRSSSNRDPNSKQENTEHANSEWSAAVAFAQLFGGIRIARRELSHG